MNVNPYESPTTFSPRGKEHGVKLRLAVGLLTSGLAFLPLCYVCIYAMWVLVFGDNRPHYILPTAVPIALCLSAAIGYVYRKALSFGTACASILALLVSLVLSALIWLMALILDDLY